VPDVLSLRSNSTLSMDMKFKYTENKKKQLLKSLSIPEKDLTEPIVHIKVKNLSGLKTYFAPSYSDCVEGVKMDSDKYSNQLLRLSLSRVKRIISFIKVTASDFNDIFRFKYPFFSFLCFMVMKRLFLIPNGISYLHGLFLHLKSPT